MAMRSGLTALLALVLGFAPGMLACDGGGSSTGGAGGDSTSSSSTSASVGGGGSGGIPTSSSTGETGGSAGSGGTVAPFCGDGIANAGEECDGPDLQSADCTGYGFSTKSGVTCTSDCKLDPSGCKATCNGVLLEPGEECDGVNLGNHDCTEFGFTKKAGAKCNSTCTGVVIGNCAPTCDGAAVEPGEDCDGADLGGFTCQDFGYDDPSGLVCAGCQPDSTGCLSSCDGNTLEPGEECDGTDLNGKTCMDFGYASAAGLACTPTCTLSSAGCTASCGNGVVEPNEQCDGSAPAGAICTNGCVLKYTTVINEVWYDPPGTDSTSASCFIELKGPPGLDLTGYALKFVDGLDGTEYVAQLKLDTHAIGQTGYFVVVQSAAQLANLPAGTTGMSSGKADLQNGPDSLVLVNGATVVDAIGYGTFMANFAGEGTPAQDPANAAQTLCRLPDGDDTNDNGPDFVLCTPTAGASNLP